MRCFAASSQGRVALATLDDRILFFGPNVDSDPIAEIPAPFSPIRLLFTDKGATLLVVAEYGQLATVGMDGGVQPLQWPRGMTKPTYIVAASDAPVIAVLCPNNMIEVLALKKEILSSTCTIRAKTPVLWIALDPSGKRAYALTEQLGLKVVSWQVDTPREDPTNVAVIQSGMPPVPIAFIERELVAIGDGLDLLLFSISRPETATRRIGHDEPLKVIVSGAGLIASVAGCFQNTNFDQLRLWTTEGQPLGPVTLPEIVIDIAFCPDRSALLALGVSGTLWRITLRIQDWIETARRIAGRGLTKEEQHQYGIDAWRAQAGLVKS